MDEAGVCQLVVELTEHVSGIEQLMFPPPPAQPPTVYKDPPARTPFVCARIPGLFKALRCGDAS